MADLVYINGSARIRPGTYGQQQIGTAYAFTAFPQQIDQPDSLPWYPPVDPSDAISEAAEFITGFGASRKAFGGYEGTLHFGALTPGMVAYLKSYLFAGEYAADVTMMLWDRQQGWIIVNAILTWNDPARSAEPGGLKGYLNLKLDWHSGGIADYGLAFSTAFSSAFG
jgi:hypothetical protein